VFDGRDGKVGGKMRNINFFCFVLKKNGRKERVLVTIYHHTLNKKNNEEMFANEG
jgi:hypothetical protein